MIIPILFIFIVPIFVNWMLNKNRQGLKANQGGSASKPLDIDTICDFILFGYIFPSIMLTGATVVAAGQNTPTSAENTTMMLMFFVPSITSISLGLMLKKKLIKTATEYENSTPNSYIDNSEIRDSPANKTRGAKAKDQKETSNPKHHSFHEWLQDIVSNGEQSENQEKGNVQN